MDDARTSRWARLRTAAARVLQRTWTLVFLGWLIPPIWHNARAGTTQGWVNAAIFALFTVLYTILNLMAGKCYNQGRDRAGRSAGLLLMGMVACTGVVMWSAPRDSVSCFPYLAIASVMTLPLRAALPLVGVYTVTAALWADQQIALGIIVAACGVGMSFAVLAIRRGHEADAAREANTHLALQEERNRMARDLHDILGHSLTVITVKAELAGKLIDIDPARAKAELADVEQLSRSALADVRRTVTSYREVSLAGELAGARQALTAAGIRPVLPGAVDDVQPDLRELFAWVVREGVTNVIRHSGASVCEVRLTSSSIEIRDDGQGPAPQAGNGLNGLRERARTVGAVVEFSRAARGGFVLRAAPGGVIRAAGSAVVPPAAASPAERVG